MKRATGISRTSRNSEGFTLMELVVVLGIILVFTSIAVPVGLGWIGTHRFTAMVRAFPNAVLMARMRGIENRNVITITGTAQDISSPFSACCPGMKFTTNVDHGLSAPNPALSNYLVCSSTVGCPGTACSPVLNSVCRKNLVSTSTTAGDVVMISGLDKHLSMNGVEFEVLKVPANNQFVVQHAWTGVPGDPPAATPAADATGTVRRLTAPGSLRIEPAAPVTTATTIPNEENFQASGYTVKEEGSSVVIRYNTDQFLASVDGQPLDTTTFTSAQLNFDNRGFPTSVQVVGRDGNPVQFGSQLPVFIEEKVTTGGKKAARQVLYQISPAGKVDTEVASH